MTGHVSEGGLVLERDVTSPDGPVTAPSAGDFQPRTLDAAQQAREPSAPLTSAPGTLAPLPSDPLSAPQTTVGWLIAEPVTDEKNEPISVTEGGAGTEWKIEFSLGSGNREDPRFAIPLKLHGEGLDG